MTSFGQLKRRTGSEIGGWWLMYYNRSGCCLVDGWWLVCGRITRTSSNIEVHTEVKKEEVVVAAAAAKRRWYRCVAWVLRE